LFGGSPVTSEVHRAFDSALAIYPKNDAKRASPWFIDPLPDTIVLARLFLALSSKELAIAAAKMLLALRQCPFNFR
jgi:hypothetical protein